MTATYNDVADLLELCLQPVGSGTDRWPTAATWCQNEPACDHDGNPIPSLSVGAVAWCPVGRLMAVAYRNSDVNEPSDISDKAFTLLNETVNMPGPKKDGTNIANWNDHPGRTAHQVAELFDRAIAAARLQGDRPVLENAAHQSM